MRKEINKSPWSFGSEASVAASEESLRNAWRDVSRWSKWHSELLRADSPPLALGVEGTLVPRRGPKRFDVTQWRSVAAHAFRMRLLFASLSVRRSVEKVSPETTRFRHEVSVEGPLAPVFFWLIGRGFRRVLPDVMRRLGVAVQASVGR